MANGSGRRPTCSDDYEEKFGKLADRVLAERAASGKNRGGLTRTELAAAVSDLFCQGYTATETRWKMEELHGVTLRREEPYIIWGYAARKGWFHFRPPGEVHLATRLKALHRWLDRVTVVKTAVVDHVANSATELVVERIVEHASRGGGKRAVHVGLSGGVAVWKVAQEAARRLQTPIPGLPETIVLHALVAGFDSDLPTTDPNAYFAFFTNPAPLDVKVLTVNLRAPDIIVESEHYEAYKRVRGIKRAFDAAKDLDIILTSASDWTDDHNMLRRYMEQCPTSTATLKGERPVGDMLWRPFNAGGAIEAATEIRAMTLLELRHLPRFIERGKDVVLVLGPCGGCQTPKGRVLKTLLEMKVPLFNHLVVDTRTVREALPAEEQEAA